MDGGNSGLSARLRVATQALHLEAERSGYVQEILKRRASLAGYALFLRNLLPAYQALERALAHHADHPVHELFVWPPLFRSAAIITDLRALAGTRSENDWPLLPEGQAYADHLENIDETDPVRLIGHAYVRYIGDLSGGQIVKSLLTASPGLEPAMLGFYDFPGIFDAEVYKDNFRASLDRAGVVAGNAEAIVNEAQCAFRLNINLSRAVLKSLSRPVGQRKDLGSPTRSNAPGRP